MTGVTLVAMGAVLLMAAAVDLADGADVAPRLASAGAVTAATGLILWRLRPLPLRLRTVEAFAAVAVAAGAFLLASTSTYLFTDTFDRFDLALFESVAGFSTTALSVLQPLEATPDGILFWRASTQWLGGLGAVLLVVGILPSLGLAGLEIAPEAGRQSSMVLVTPHVRTLLRRLVALYLVLTAVGAGLYLMGGMDPFDAVTYAFTTISTGGFGNHPGSFAHFDSATLEWAAIGGMVLAGLNLALLWRLVRRSAAPLLRSTELRAYAAVLAIGSITLVLWTAPPDGVSADSARHAVFTVASAVSTTGFTVANWGTWAIGAQLLLLTLIGVGSMSGSTGGGFRILRALTLLAYVRREVVRQLHPRAVIAMKVGRVPIDEGVASRMIGHQAMYVAVAAAGTVVVAAFDVDITTAISGAVSAMATYGPALGDLAPPGSALVLDEGGRAVMMVLMLVGRLEIYPVLLGAGAVSAVRRGRVRS